MARNDYSRMTVEIMCAVFNGERYLPDLLDSLARQTHGEWRLWARDDGSTDASVDIVRAAAASDPRIQPIDIGGPRLGASASFGRLLTGLPSDAAYMMFADQDDVWKSTKIERTLATMRAVEARHPAEPILVHTDLVVVDEDLREIHSSFWKFAAIDPDATTLRRLIVRNVATGATAMLNRPLRELVDPIPPEAILHDWWTACVAGALGHVVALRESTILYRQHDTNAVGARAWDIAVTQLPRAIIRGIESGRDFRHGLELTAAQARAFRQRFSDQLTDDDRRFLDAYSGIPQRRFWGRKLDLIRLRTLPEYGMLRTLGILLRG
jgi:hypothetical protein